MNTGKTIKTLRKYCNISQLELSKLSKIAQSDISKLENNKLDLSPFLAKKLSKVLLVPPAMIYALSMEQKDVSKVKSLNSDIDNFKLAVTRFFAAYQNIVQSDKMTRFNKENI
jgi:transcriptional regulator with XRE-family HTH domain